MRVSHKIIIVALLFFAAFSCKKETIKTQGTIAASSDLSESATSSIDLKWTGLYVEGNGNGIDTVSETDFIANGIAQLQNSPYTYYYTALQLPIKKNIISGDSLSFVARLKNPSSGGITDYDVSLLIEGSKNSAHVTFIGYRPEFTSMGAGTAQITYVPELLHVFEDFTNISLVVKDKTLSVYMNGALTKSLSIDTQEVGKVKKLQLSFKGSGTVDWVKLFNSYSGAPLLVENFN